jgi:hypothetical protein
VQQTLDNEETIYFMNASLGTPEQRFQLHIDTGSSDLWVNAANSSLCTQAGSQCRRSGTYDLDASSSFEFVSEDFNISYVDGSGAAGIYGRDTFHFGGKSIDGLQFGIGFVSTSPEGILGIGYTINEVQVNRFHDEPYPNLPQLLVDNGDINTNAYSLWLNDLDASTGSILFGGVDTEKFEGDLSTLPILPHQGSIYAEFNIALTALGQNGQQGSIFQNENVPVLLDSGSSLMYLPDDVVRSLYSSLNGEYDAAQGAAFVDCGLANEDGSLEFTFSGITISVPYNELVVTIGQASSGERVCILGLSPAGDSPSVLGDTFLRSAYVVYDLENNEISMAQTNFNATGSSIQEIQSGHDGVPDASVVPNAVSTAPVATGGGRINGPNVNPTSRSSSDGTIPMVTPGAWLGAGAALGGMGMILGFNGF